MIEQQFENTRVSMSGIVELIRMGYRLAITHGNGPQVGDLLRQQEAGAREGIPALPLGVLNAATEGSMGLMIEQSLQNELAQQGLSKSVITVVSQVLVDRDDPSMQNPTKYVGSRYYSQAEAEELRSSLGWMLKEDAGKGFRRVVPSPYPKRIIAADRIKSMVDDGVIVIAVGGGGIPVCAQNDGSLKTVDAVIDKDFASMLLARAIWADLLVILTGVEKVCADYSKPSQKELDRMSLCQAEELYQQGHFPAGSMGPKIRAAIDFIEGGGKEVLITSIQSIVEGFAGKTGTRIVG